MVTRDDGDSMADVQSIVDYFDFVTLQDAVQYSDLIVIAELVDETSRREAYVNQRGQATGDYQRLVERTFLVREALKGEVTGQKVRVSYGTVIEHHTTRQKFVFPMEIPAAEVGRLYVLFLDRSVDNRGRSMVSPAGEPSVALVTNDRVEFQPTERYRFAARKTELLSTVSLDAVRSAVR
jgi:hypothetical protein